jgi:hypothetical protein
MGTLCTSPEIAQEGAAPQRGGDGAAGRRREAKRISQQQEMKNRKQLQLPETQASSNHRLAATANHTDPANGFRPSHLYFYKHHAIFIILLDLKHNILIYYIFYKRNLRIIKKPNQECCLFCYNTKYQFSTM